MLIHINKNVGYIILTKPITPRVTVPLRSGKQQQHLLNIAMVSCEQMRSTREDVEFSCL